MNACSMIFSTVAECKSIRWSIQYSLYTKSNCIRRKERKLQRKKEWILDKYSHKNNNNKTLNNFEILCQQTWFESPVLELKTVSHIRNGERMIAMMTICICVHKYIFIYIAHFIECVWNGHGDHTSIESGVLVSQVDERRFAFQWLVIR